MLISALMHSESVKLYETKFSAHSTKANSSSVHCNVGTKLRKKLWNLMSSIQKRFHIFYCKLFNHKSSNNKNTTEPTIRTESFISSWL